jgi:ketosteroid isomerase-like protein
MSQENRDVFNKGMDAFGRGDWDTLAATLDPDILLRADPRWPEQRIYGREAVIAFWRGLRESWGPDAHVEKVVDLGDRLLIRWRFIVRGHHSGVRGEQSISAVQTYREGRLILIENFLEHDEALKAVGLEE